MDRIGDEVSFLKREVPKIDGSSTVVVLVAIIIISGSAVIYILRATALEDQEAQRRRQYVTQPLADSSVPPNSRYSQKWYSHFWSSRDRHHHPRLDKPVGRSEQGWVRANDREWDVNSADVPGVRSPGGNQLNILRMSERGESRLSVVGPGVYMPRADSPISDAASSTHYDPHAPRGLPYPEQYTVSPQATVPGMQSQSYSPTLSSPPSPVPRQTTRSPEPIANAPLSHDSSQDSIQDSLQRSTSPVLRTFGSGTRFFEAI